MTKLADLLCARRRNKSRIPRITDLEQFYSDQSRILFSSSFRHMVQKAQVFPLEANTAVRNRLTHTLEVADIGRSIARVAAHRMKTSGLISDEDGQCMEVIVGNACLLHDIGNPPFGHFGESAIRAWFKAVVSNFNAGTSAAGIYADLIRFDGNPQGFRIATTLHNERDEFGLNLTASSLLAAIKYPANRGSKPLPMDESGKLGVFSTEEHIWRDICTFAEHDPNKRYVLSYLMEAADDICYCTSDIADAIEKGIVRIVELRDYFKTHYKGVLPDAIANIDMTTHFSIDVAVKLSRVAMCEVADNFVERFDQLIQCGSQDPLLGATHSNSVYEVLRRFAKEHIYTDRDVQRIEIAGYHIIHGLLKHLTVLDEVERSTFEKYVRTSTRPKGDGRNDLAWRVFCQLGVRVKKAYLYAVDSEPTMSDEQERLLRYRLIVDYVSSLTDQYALALHQLFSGSSL